MFVREGLGRGVAGSLSDAFIRLTDVLVATALLLLLSPAMLVTFAGLSVATRRSVLVARFRFGRNGLPISYYEFRTDRVPEGELRPLGSPSDPPHMLDMGALLRATGLYATPRLIAVVKGDLSLVGPRPLLAGQIPHYGRFYGRYCSVRPGMTGLWQLYGTAPRSGFRKRMAMDLLYIRKRNLVLHLWVLLSCVVGLMLRERLP